MNARPGDARLPNWSPDGDELLYNEGDDSLRKVSSSGASDSEIVGENDFDSEVSAPGYEIFVSFDGSSWAGDDTVVFSADPEVGTTPQLVVRHVLWQTGPNGGSGFTIAGDVLIRDDSAYGFEQFRFS